MQDSFIDDKHVPMSIVLFLYVCWFGVFAKWHISRRGLFNSKNFNVR